MIDSRQTQGSGGEGHACQRVEEREGGKESKARGNELQGAVGGRRS